MEEKLRRKEEKWRRIEEKLRRIDQDGGEMEEETGEMEEERGGTPSTLPFAGSQGSFRPSPPPPPGRSERPLMPPLRLRSPPGLGEFGRAN